MYEEMIKYITVAKSIKAPNNWFMISDEIDRSDCPFQTQSIHKKHKDILGAYLADSSVSICIKYQGLFKVDDFISEYDEDCNYVLSEPDEPKNSKLTNEDKQEISDQIDEISLNEQIEKQLTFKVSSSTILVGTGKDIANNIGSHLNKDYEYEIIIKQLKP